jgi:NAD(P)-dependent dehydrogenase (short-subunit alcohol dehydrogenase family)
LITGAARGIGEHTARLAAAKGARVALAGLEPDRLRSIAAELDGLAFDCDVRDQASLDAAVAGTVSAFGRLHAVVANAGVANRGTVAVGDIEALAGTVEINLIGVMRTAKAAVEPLLASRGYFLALSSAAAFTALPGMAAYCASKAGVEQFCNAFRLEVAHAGVRVGSAHPSWVDTDLVRDAGDDLPSFRGSIERIPGPLGRITPVTACAAALVEAIVHRKRRVYVPKSLAFVQALRTVALSPVADFVIGRGAKSSVPRMEAETRSLGRSFGAHTPFVSGYGRMRFRRS